MTDAESFGTMLTNSMEEAAAEIDENEFQPVELFPPMPNANNPPGVSHRTQATYAEIVANPSPGEPTINVTKQHLQNVRKKKSRYTNASREQNHRYQNYGYGLGSHTQHSTHSPGSDQISDPLEIRRPPTEVNVSSMSETPTTEMEKLITELRRANAAHALANETQALQIANLTATVDSYSAMQTEMAFLREGMKLLLQNQASSANQSEPSTALALANEPEGKPSSNKRQNTMSTPTKPRPDSLPICPDVDIEMQHQDQNE